jgi:glycolate oxidase FAD binding subunit
MRRETIPEFGEFQDVQVAQPTSIAELSQAVREAVAQGQAVFPLGGRTMLGLGLPPSKHGIGVDLRSLDQVIDYPARDMTITVQAGITIAKLQANLAKENQQLPVDVPIPEQATLGGAIAVNASGPRRYGYGTLRDYVIGISFFNDEGQEIKAGGRVVKNVAGYDLMKLHIGALGTLGIITQVTLKLRPRPDEASVCYFACAEETIGPVLEMLQGSRVRPASVDMVNSAFAELATACPPGKWLVFIGLEGNEQSLAWQSTQLHSDLQSRGVSAIWASNGGPRASYGKLANCQLRSEARLTFKANVLTSQVDTFVRRAAALPELPLLLSHAGNGIIYGHVNDLTLNDSRTMLTTLLKAVGPEGNVVVTRCPPEWKRELPIWGKPRGDYWLMRRVKETLDPRWLFNPGRFVDGI